MTSELSHHDARRAIDRHFEGRIAPRAERAMRAHVPECAECRAYYDRYLMLARLDPAVPPASARLGRALGLEASRARPARLWLLPAFALAGVAAVVLALPRSEDSGFTARGRDAGAPSGGPVVVFRVGDHDRRELVDDRMNVADELAFAYRNPSSKKYLLIFGVDDTGRVYWYVPQWLDPASRPRAAPAEPGSDLHHFPVAVRHEIVGSSMWVHTLLLDEPLDVFAVEKLVRGLPSPSSALALGGAVQEVITLRVDH